MSSLQRRDVFTFLKETYHTLQQTCSRTTTVASTKTPRPPTTPSSSRSAASILFSLSKAKPRPNRLRKRLTGKQPAPGGNKPKRQICAQELHFCLAHFPTAVKCRKHSCSCRSMPYKMWLSRIRQTQHEVTVSDHPCPICGIKFWTAHAKGRHSFVCKQRRDAERK